MINKTDPLLMGQFFAENMQLYIPYLQCTMIPNIVIDKGDIQMEKVESIIKVFTAGITAVATYMFGGIDLAFGILLTLISTDYATGVIAAVVNSNLSSEISYKGIFKKAGILIVVSLAHLIGTYLNFEVRAWVIGYYIANEGISILENTGHMGVPYPTKLTDILSQLKEE